MNKDLQLTILFKEYHNEDYDFPIFIPYRPMLGTMSMKTAVFVESLTGQLYVNTDLCYAMDLPEGYNCLVSIKELMKQYKTKDMYKAIRIFWRAFETMVCTYKEDTLEFVIQTKEDFEETYGTNLNNLVYTAGVNELTMNLMEGKIDGEEYFNSMYLIEEDDIDNIEIEKLNPIKDTVSKIKKSIVSQDDAVKSLITQIYKSRIFNLKSNILIYGPSGVGKTALIKAISKEIGIPVLIEDMTRYTETGYVGASVEDILVNLYNNSDGNLSVAENSILFLDEIDKKASNGNYDFNKGDVLKSLLKIIEGGTFDIKVSRDRTITFDTSKLIVVVGGAFSGIYKKNIKKTKIGFGSDEGTEELDDSIDVKDFEKYGMPREFMGRMTSIIRMNELKKEDLIKILKTSDLSMINTYLNVFKEKNIDINIPSSLYEKIAELGISKGTGARGLNSVVEDIFNGILYDIFENIESIERVDINDDIIQNSESYVLKRKKV